MYCQVFYLLKRSTRMEAPTGKQTCWSLFVTIPVAAATAPTFETNGGYDPPCGLPAKAKPNVRVEGLSHPRLLSRGLPRSGRTTVHLFVNFIRFKLTTLLTVALGATIATAVHASPLDRDREGIEIVLDEREIRTAGIGTATITPEISELEFSLPGTVVIPPHVAGPRIARQLLPHRFAPRRVTRRSRLHLAITSFRE